MTRVGDGEKQIKKKYRIQGVPTIVFIDGTGMEYESLRVTGFLGPRQFSKILEQVSKNSK